MKKFGYILLALCLPPVAVFLKRGLPWHLALNVFLCLAFFLPAMVHGVWFVTRNDGGDGQRRMAEPVEEPAQQPQRQEPSF